MNNKILNKSNFKIWSKLGMRATFGIAALELPNTVDKLIILTGDVSTSAGLDRFKKKFKTNPLLWHSDIKGSEKIKIWKSILEDNVNIVVGARSSLFLPFKNLGLIIIDEEHDQSFKQEEGIIYNARDMAVVRAKISNIPIILCSAK